MNLGSDYMNAVYRSLVDGMVVGTGVTLTNTIPAKEWYLCDNPTYKRKFHYHAARPAKRWKK